LFGRRLAATRTLHSAGAPRVGWVGAVFLNPADRHSAWMRPRRRTAIAALSLVVVFVSVFLPREIVLCVEPAGYVHLEDPVAQARCHAARNQQLYAGGATQSRLVSPPCADLPVLLGASSIPPSRLVCSPPTVQAFRVALIPAASVALRARSTHRPAPAASIELQLLRSTILLV